MDTEAVSHGLEWARKQFSFDCALVFVTSFSALTRYTYPVYCANQQHAFLICLPGVCI